MQTNTVPEILFFKIDSVDEAKREVTGIAAEETPDKEKEIFDYVHSKPELQKWSSKFDEVTDGKSLGNVRLMHGPVVAGKVTNLGFDDLNKRVTITSKVLNDDVWKLILEGGLTGYSFGGKKMILGHENGNRRYKAIPAEVSYVDNPCLYGATFTSVKADGMTEMRKFAHSDSELLAPETVEIGGREYRLIKRDFSDEERSKLADEGKALPDGSFPIENAGDLGNAIQAIGRAKDPEKAKAHIRARAKALGRTDLLPESWAGESEKFAKSASTGDEAMTAEDLKKFETLEGEVKELKKMSEAHLAHLHSINTHLDGAKEHLMAMCDGEKMAKAATNDGAPTGFVSIGKTADGVEIFKKAPVDPNATAIEALKKTVEDLTKRTETAEKCVTDLTTGIKETLSKGVKIPGVANAAGLTVVTKEKDGGENKDKKNEDLSKTFGSAAEAAKDPDFLKDVLANPVGNERDFLMNRRATA